MYVFSPETSKSLQLLSIRKRKLRATVLNRFKKKSLQIRSYFPPSPPSGSGPHRYAILVFRQETSASPVSAAPNPFKTADLIKDAGLVPKPEAFNFFLAERKE